MHLFRLFLLLLLAAPLMASELPLYTTLTQRFPELNLPEEAPDQIHFVQTPDQLTEALKVQVEHLVIALSGTLTLSSTLSVSASDSSPKRITLVGMTSDGTFTPATIKGKGLNLGGTVDLANLTFTAIEETTYGAITLATGATANLSSLTLHTLTAPRGALFILGNATCFNLTIGENCKNNYAPLLLMGTPASATLQHCTLATTDEKNIQIYSGTLTLQNVLFQSSPPSGTPAGYIVSDNLTWTNSAGTLPHFTLHPTSSAINTASVSATLQYDALGNNRTFGSAPDYGAVEHHAAPTISFPDDLVILPSGQRQVYVGWSSIDIANSYQLQRSTDNGITWATLPDADLLWRDQNAMENTISGWQSVRYLRATPGETATYRLAASLDNGLTWTYSDPVTLTQPTPVGPYHSRPQSKKKIYLDFSGAIDDYAPHVAQMKATFATSHPDKAVKNYIQIPHFFFAGAFYNQELGTTTSEVYPRDAAIYDIWRMVAEDFAIFDVDVTTEEPPYEALVKSSQDDDTYGKRVILDPGRTPDGTIAIWYPGAGGQSCLASFGFRDDRPAYVFGCTSRQELSAQVTHEVAHTLGLTHDSGTIYFGGAFLGREYYQGVTYSNTNIRWYPILGAVPFPSSYNGLSYDSGDFINQFSSCNTSGITNEEDDFAILFGITNSPNESHVIVDTKAPLYPIATRNLSPLPDDAGDTLDDAKKLPTTPRATTYSGQGLIGKHLTTIDDTTTITNDIDTYTFTIRKAGTLTLSIIPSYLGKEEGASLDAALKLYNAAGELLAESHQGLDSKDFRHATLSNLSLPAGTYYFQVFGTYQPLALDVAPEGYTSPWYPNPTNAYGSVGPYTISITLQDTTFGSSGYRLYLK